MPHLDRLGRAAERSRHVLEYRLLPRLGHQAEQGAGLRAIAGNGAAYMR
jgi:hypothetical protein